MRLSNYLSEQTLTGKTLIFVDTGLQVGRRGNNSVLVVKLSNDKLKILDVYYHAENQEELADKAVLFAKEFNAARIYVFRTLLSHHVSQWIKEKAKAENVRAGISLLDFPGIGSGFSEDEYEKIKANVQSGKWQGIVKKVPSIRSALYGIYTLTLGD